MLPAMQLQLLRPDPRARPEPARCSGRATPCWSWPTCTWRRAAPSPGAAPCCRPTTAMPRWRGWRRWSTRWRPDTVVSLGDGFHDRRGPLRPVAGPVRPAAAPDPQPALGLGHRQPRPGGAAGRWAVPPWPSCASTAWCCATRPTGAVGRDRRPPPSQGAPAHPPAPPRPPLLRRRCRPAAAAGLRQLYRRPQRA